MSQYLKIYSKYKPSDTWELFFDSTVSGSELTDNKFENIRASINGRDVKVKFKIEASTKEIALDFIGIVYYFKRVK